MYRRAENQCHSCAIYHFQTPDLICETPAEGTLPVRHLNEMSMLKRKTEQSETSILKLQAHIEKGTCLRDFRYVAKANVTPDEEFKTEQEKPQGH